MHAPGHSAGAGPLTRLGAYARSYARGRAGGRGVALYFLRGGWHGTCRQVVFVGTGATSSDMYRDSGGDEQCVISGFRGSKLQVVTIPSGNASQR